MKLDVYIAINKGLYVRVLRRDGTTSKVSLQMPSIQRAFLSDIRHVCYPDPTLSGWGSMI